MNQNLIYVVTEIDLDMESLPITQLFHNQEDAKDYTQARAETMMKSLDDDPSEFVKNDGSHVYIFCKNDPNKKRQNEDVSYLIIMQPHKVR